MKVRIIKANGIKEFEPVFDLEFLEQFAKNMPTFTLEIILQQPVDPQQPGGLWKYTNTADIMPYSSSNGGLWKNTNTADIMPYSSSNGTTINNEAFFKISSISSPSS